MNEHVGVVIKKLRKEKRMPLREVAEKVNMSHSYLSQIENGDRNASPQLLSNLSKVLGVSKLYLFKASGYLDETDILNLVDENKRLREVLENVQDQLFSIRGLDKVHDGEITGLCIEICKALEGEDIA